MNFICTSDCHKLEVTLYLAQCSVQDTKNFNFLFYCNKLKCKLRLDTGKYQMSVLIYALFKRILNISSVLHYFRDSPLTLVYSVNWLKLS